MSLMAEAIVDIDAAQQGESDTGDVNLENRRESSIEETLSKLSSILSEVADARKDSLDKSTTNFIQKLSQSDVQDQALSGMDNEPPPKSLVHLLSNFAVDFNDVQTSKQVNDDESRGNSKDILEGAEEIIGDEDHDDILENWEDTMESVSDGPQEDVEALSGTSGGDSSESGSGSDSEENLASASLLKGKQHRRLSVIEDDEDGGGEEAILPKTMHSNDEGAPHVNLDGDAAVSRSFGMPGPPDRIQIQGQGDLLIKGWEEIVIGDSGKVQAPVVTVDIEGFSSAVTRDVVVLSHSGNQYFVRIDIFRENISKVSLSQIVEEFGSLNAVGAITGAASVEGYTVVSKKVVMDVSGSRIPYIIGDICLNETEQAEKGTKADVSRFAIVELHGKKYQVDLVVFERNIKEKNVQYVVEEYGKLLDGHSGMEGLSKDSLNDELVYTMLDGGEGDDAKVLVDTSKGEYEVGKANFENLLSCVPLDQILSEHGTLRTSPLEGREALTVCVTNDIDLGKKVIKSPVAGEITYHVRERVFEEATGEVVQDKPKRRRRKKALVMVEGVEYEVDLQTFETKVQRMNVKEVVTQFGHKTTWNQLTTSKKSSGVLERQEVVLANGKQIVFFIGNRSGVGDEVEDGDQRFALVEYNGGMYEVDYTVFIHLVKDRSIASIVNKFGSLRSDLGNQVSSQPEDVHTAYKTINIKYQQGTPQDIESE